MFANMFPYKGLQKKYGRICDSFDKNAKPMTSLFMGDSSRTRMRMLSGF